MLEIKTISYPLAKSAEFDAAVNDAIADGWRLRKRELVRPQSPQVTQVVDERKKSWGGTPTVPPLTLYAEPILYAELEKGREYSQYEPRDTWTPPGYGVK